MAQDETVGDAVKEEALAEGNHFYAGCKIRNLGILLSRFFFVLFSN